MGIESLTYAADSTWVVPATNEQWDDWVSASSTRNYLLRNPIIDWLERYGETKGFRRDTELAGYDERLEFVPFIMRKGTAFEAAIVEYLSSRTAVLTVAESREDNRDLAAAERTFWLLAHGQPIVHQAVLRDPETLTYGAADLLVRSDLFADLFPDNITADEAAVPAPDLGPKPWHYIVVDVKFTTLHLLAGGQVGNSGSAPAYKAQLYVYNRALGRLQGYTPPTAFLLGRGWEQTVKRLTTRSTNAMDRLGPVSMADDIRVQVEAACYWLRRVRNKGADWSPLPSPTVPELWPKAGDEAFPWNETISLIANSLDELTQLWWVGPDKRDAAHRNGIFSWRDPKATAASLGVTGATTQPTLQAILEVNQTDEGPAVRPAHVATAEEEWRPIPPIEFYVDFETVNSVNDDFSKVPEQNGQNLIFMIGCGHLQDNEWVFKCFSVDRLNEGSEAVMMDDWLAHMSTVNSLLDGEKPRLIHWSYAEPVDYEKAYDSARERHPNKGWPAVNWFDLWAKVVRREPVVVRGALNFGLKSFARAMHSHGLIETSWGDTKVDGLGAMTGAWWCDEEAGNRGVSMIDTDLMQEIARYNEVDCKVMMEIVRSLRMCH